jgi:hypothetical protein
MVALLIGLVIAGIIWGVATFLENKRAKKQERSASDLYDED